MPASFPLVCLCVCSMLSVFVCQMHRNASVLMINFMPAFVSVCVWGGGGGGGGGGAGIFVLDMCVRVWFCLWI